MNDRARQTGSVTVTTSPRAQAQSSPPPAQARSQGIALRRGLTLLGMTLVVPGSAQLVGGNERLGRAALRVWFSLIGFVVFYTTLAIVDVYLMARTVRIGPGIVGEDPAAIPDPGSAGPRRHGVGGAWPAE